MVAVVLCSGYHSAALTEEFARGLGWASEALAIFPNVGQSPPDGVALYNYLRDRLPPPSAAPPLLLIAFSAGAVAATTGSLLWQQQGGRIAATITVDGWGVPDLGAAPLHRLSHDRFTHWSSALLGAGHDSFWAEPAVEHLQLWRSPHTVTGWWQLRPGWRSRCTAAQFLQCLSSRYAAGNRQTI